EGALVTPAFVDAHVHITSTGLALTGLDLSAATSLADALRQVEDAARRSRGGIVLGHGWDETRWPEHRAPTRHELDRASYGGVVYLSRIDVHSAAVSSALLAAVPEARGELGFHDSGHVTREAHHLVRRVARESVAPAQRRSLHLAALRHAAGLGIATVHELAGPDISSREDLEALLALAASGVEGLPEVVPYWGELAPHGVTVARSHSALGAAGDLFTDGSIGSHTAALRDHYADADHAGHGYLTAAQVRDHVVACTEAGLQAGFHAIGDAALDAVAAGLAEAEAKLGTRALRAARHRIEHVEMVSAEAIEVFARLGVVASVQPAFDRLWGGVDGMYAERLGVERALRLNPFRALADAGVTLALGSDSPVTPLDPWGSVAAAVGHRTPGSGLTPAEAFRAHTVGGARAARRDDAGELLAGSPATFAAWDDAPLGPDGMPDPEAPSPRCRLTVRDGQVVFAR
ncbi:MAG TPA: amidohydrolase family protein, partial [Nonomuraea sp.]|nr:amidohydrolase family protein [Nonomuraea sp.]